MKIFQVVISIVTLYEIYLNARASDWVVLLLLVLLLCYTVGSLFIKKLVEFDNVKQEELTT